MSQNRPANPFMPPAGRATSAGTATAAGILIVVAAMLVAVSPAARSTYFLNNFMVLTTTLALAAAGTTIVLITGGFDLSVAGVISLGNAIAATQMTAHPDKVWLIAGAVMLLGLAAGTINGILVSFVGLQPLAVTLSSYVVLTGIALIILPAPGGSVPDTYTAPLTSALAGVPVALLIMIFIGILWRILIATRTGVAAFAIGADRQAALMSGIHVKRVEAVCYVIAGGLYALASLYLSAVTASGDPRAGQPFLLTAFAAMAVGLVRFKGGRGSAVAAMIGAATLTAIPKLLFAFGIGDFWVGVFQGAIILIALSIPIFTRRLRRRGLSQANVQVTEKAA